MADHRAAHDGDVEDLVDLRAVWFGLRRRAGMFFAVAATTFAAIAIAVFLAPRQYTAETSIMIAPKKELFVYGDKGPTERAPDPQLVDTEVELLRSRAMAIRVLERMSAEDGGDGASIDWRARRPANDFFEKRLADVAADFASLQAAASGDRAPSGDRALSGERAAPATAEPGDAAAAIGEFDPLAGAPGAADDDVPSAELARVPPPAVNDALRRLDIERVGTTFLIKIRFSDRIAERSAQIANAYAEEYILQQLEAQYQSLRQTNAWIDTRLRVLREDLRVAEEKAAKFRAEQGIVEPAGDGVSFTEKSITGIAAELTAARSNFATLNARYNTIRGLLDANAPIDSVSEVMASPVVADLRRQQTEIARRRAELRVRYGELHPELKKIAEESAGLEAQISGEVRRIVQSLAAEVRFAQAQVASLEKGLKDAQIDLATGKSASVEFLDLQRDIEASRGVYEALLNRQKELNERDGLADANARIIAIAETPDSPSKPRRKLLLAAGAMIALLLASAVAFAAETLDTRIRNTGDVRRAFGPSAPVVLIPRIKSRFLFRQKSHIDLVRRHLRDDPNSPFAQALRDLRLQLKSAERDSGKPVSIAFASVFRGEGATTTAFAFASLLAQSGAKVAFIDCAGQTPAFKPSLRQGLGGQDADAPSLLEDRSQELRRDADASGDAETAAAHGAEAASQSIALHRINELRARPAGGAPTFRQRDVAAGVATFEMDERADAFEELDPDALMQGLHRTGRDFDYVVIDAPAILDKPEASIVAAAATFVVLVMEWCSTTRSAASAAAQRLVDARARLLTFALAKVDERQRFFFRPEDRQFYFRKARS